METTTFNQKSALTICIIAMVIAALMYFIPTKADAKSVGVIVGLFIAIALKGAGFLFSSSSSSQAKDATIAKAQDALYNSTPIIPNEKPI